MAVSQRAALMAQAALTKGFSHNRSGRSTSHATCKGRDEDGAATLAFVEEEGTRKIGYIARIIQLRSTLASSHLESRIGSQLYSYTVHGLAAPSRRSYGDRAVPSEIVTGGPSTRLQLISKAVSM